MRALCIALILTACSPAEPPRHLLIISIDTLRADHLGAYGYPLRTSPNLDAFAQEAVVFDDTQSTSTWTLPSHASMLTGLYPQNHGVRDNQRRLGEHLPTLAAMLAEAGFRTRALVNTVYLLPHFGLGRGFDDYTPMLDERGRRGSAPELTDEALRWLRADSDTRSFLFLHYFDVHSDYESQPRFERMFAPKAGRYPGTTRQLTRLTRLGEPLPPDDLAYIRLLYDAGIRQLDESLGGLFAALAEDGWIDDAIVVVTSDHGEEFQEHGGFLHGRTHFREQTRIPLIIRVPGLTGRRVYDPVSLVDIVPTVLPLLGVTTGADLDGVDLGAALRGGSGPDARALFVAGGPGGRRDEMRSIRRGRFKLTLDRAVGWVRLYDLLEDPDETVDVSAAHPEVVASLAAAIGELDAVSIEAPLATELDSEMRERLRALGYEE